MDNNHPNTDLRLFKCSECGLLYKDEEWAEQCKKWCKEHKSCNLEIIAHAISSTEKPHEKFAEQEFVGKELYELKRKKKEESRKKEHRKETLTEVPRKIGRYLLYSLIGVGIVGGLGWFIATRPTPLRLSPATMQGHIEESPKAHIVDAPIPNAIQRHMLEHADGKGKPGIIIQYNCQKYACEPDLIQKLTDLVKQYPDNVYLGPNDYDGKIILTKEGKLEALDQFDEQKIKDFISL